MSILQRSSAIERVAGHSATEAALTLLAAQVGTPLAALLPVLGKSLAAERQRQRLEQAFREVAQTLAAHEALIANLTDSQFKLINESILALFQANESKKLDYLRACIRGALSIEKIDDQEAVTLSRLVRDISADEADFLIQNFNHQKIQLQSCEISRQHQCDVLKLDPDSKDGLIVQGLASLGLLIPFEATWGMTTFKFSRLAAKLIVLLRA